MRLGPAKFGRLFAMICSIHLVKCDKMPIYQKEDAPARSGGDETCRHGKNCRILPKSGARSSEHSLSEESSLSQLACAACCHMQCQCRDQPGPRSGHVVHSAQESLEMKSSPHLREKGRRLSDWYCIPKVGTVSTSQWLAALQPNWLIQQLLLP